MCLSKAFIKDGEVRKVLCDRVKTFTSRDGKIVLKNLFDETWEIDGTVEEINFVDNYIVLKNVKSIITQ